MPWTEYNRVPYKQWEYDDNGFVGRITQYWADSFRWADYGTPGTPTGEEKTLLDAQAALLKSHYEDDVDVLIRLPPIAANFQVGKRVWIVGDKELVTVGRVASPRFLLHGKTLAVAVELDVPVVSGSDTPYQYVAVPESRLGLG